LAAWFIQDAEAELAGDVPNGVDENARGLRADHGPFPGEDEARYARDAHPLHLADLLLDGGPVRAALEPPQDVVAIEPDLGREIGQHRRVADRAALGEMQQEKPLYKLALPADRPRPPDQPMSVEGVRVALDEVEAVVHPDVLA